MGLTEGMSVKKHIIALSESERQELEKVSRSTRRSVREKTRARILLLCDANVPRAQEGSYSDRAVAARLGCPENSVSQVRRRACQRGVLPTLKRAPQSQRKARKLDGRGEATLVALTCSAPPAGAARWSLRLLRDRLIEMEVVESIALDTVRTTLKKTNLSRG